MMRMPYDEMTPAPLIYREIPPSNDREFQRIMDMKRQIEDYYKNYYARERSTMTHADYPSRNREIGNDGSRRQSEPGGVDNIPEVGNRVP